MQGRTLLKEWRTDESRKLSQEAAAKLVDVHQNTWSDWENGRKSPRAEMAMRLHLLTDGACPIESWSDDAALQDEWRERAVNDSEKAAS